MSITDSIFGAAGTYGQVKMTEEAVDFEKQKYEEAKKAYQQDLLITSNVLKNLKSKVESGELLGDEKIFKAYEQFVAPEYEKGGMFENEPRDQIVTPDRYKQMSDYSMAVGPENFNIDSFYNQYGRPPSLENNATFDFYEQQPDAYKPTDIQYDNRRERVPVDVGKSDFNQERDSYEAAQIEYDKAQAGERADLVKPEKFEYDKERTEIDDAEKYEYNKDWENQKYEGEKYLTDYDKYEGSETPEERQISDKYETGMYDTDTSGRPDIYTAEKAGEAEYYEPGEEYKRGEFSLKNDPIYQQALKDATEAVEASSAAKGMQLSGANIKAIEEEAVRLANQYGQEAYNRFNTEENARYQQYTDRQSQVKDAMRYKTEDQYRRYLDEQGIRGTEADKRIAQWENDRNIGIEQNKEAFLREQASKQLGRELNQEEFDRWKETEGIKYQQFMNEKDWTTEQQGKNVAQEWEEYAFDKGMSRNVYESDRDYSTGQEDKYQQQKMDIYDRENQNYDTDYQNALTAFQDYRNQQNTNVGRSDERYSEDLNQANIETDRGINVQQQNISNARDAYNIRNQNFGEDRAFASEEAQRIRDNDLQAYLIDQENRDKDIDRSISVQQQNIENRQAANAAGIDQYNINRDFANTQFQDQKADELARYQAQSGIYSQNLGDLMNINSMNNANNLSYEKLMADIYGTNFQNNLAVNQQNNANQFAYDTLTQDIYTTDQAFDYGVYGDRQEDAWNQYVYDNALRSQESQDKYGLLVDQYNRDLLNKNTQYQMLGDLLNTNLQTKSQLYGNGQGYVDNISDLYTGLGNIYGAAGQNIDTSLLGMLGL